MDVLIVPAESTPTEDIQELPDSSTDILDPNSDAAVSLASRIGATRVYLMPETGSGASRLGKRQREEEGSDFDVEEDALSDPTIRGNAILLQGSPISYLPTNNIFAYTTYFDAHPIALEWIDDITCILVFPARTIACTAHRHLSRDPTEDPSDDGFVSAQPVPATLWPPEERINKILGKGEGVKGTLRLRWATTADVKRKGANKESEFYRKYGKTAGKEQHLGSTSAESQFKRQRRKDNQEEEKAELDKELDAFLAGDGEQNLHPRAAMETSTSGVGEKTLLERTSQGESSWHGGRTRIRLRGQGDRRNHGWTPRGRKTVEDLDAELDAFREQGDS